LVGGTLVAEGGTLVAEGGTEVFVGMLVGMLVGVRLGRGVDVGKGGVGGSGVEVGLGGSVGAGVLVGGTGVGETKEVEMGPMPNAWSLRLLGVALKKRVGVL
jgi:hypothetical protein